MASSSKSGLAHPPRSIPGSSFSSRPPFACITPSTETWVLVVSFIVAAPSSLTLSPPPDGQSQSITYNLMVVDELPVDELFHALADSTRRDILRRCTAGEP